MRAAADIRRQNELADLPIPLALVGYPDRYWAHAGHAACNNGELSFSSAYLLSTNLSSSLSHQHNHIFCLVHYVGWDARCIQIHARLCG